MGPQLRSEPEFGMDWDVEDEEGPDMYSGYLTTTSSRAMYEQDIVEEFEEALAKDRASHGIFDD